MKKYGLLLLVNCLLLVACSNQADTSRKTSSSNSSSSLAMTEMKQSNSSSGDNSQSEEIISSTSQFATSARYNGIYYSVQGKYGEVIVVNKKHPISSNYAPGEDLAAAQSLQKLLVDMQEQGFSISLDYSGFRTYETQEELYNGYVSESGKREADRFSARPGYSEHQTGLVFDVKDGAGNLLEEPEAARWLAQNAHRYGFVVRYPKGKEAVTGYMPEPWHLRYIGDEAKNIYQSGLTLEEYYDFPGGEY